jgi:hypothetical protein
MNYINKIENECKVNRNNLDLITKTNYENLRNKLIINLENGLFDAVNIKENFNYMNIY